MPKGPALVVEVGELPLASGSSVAMRSPSAPAKRSNRSRSAGSCYSAYRRRQSPLMTSSTSQYRGFSRALAGREAKF